jgi:hypothetical protein
VVLSSGSGFWVPGSGVRDQTGFEEIGFQDLMA